MQHSTRSMPPRTRPIPDSMTAILSGAGLVAVRERTYTGGLRHVRTCRHPGVGVHVGRWRGHLPRLDRGQRHPRADRRGEAASTDAVGNASVWLHDRSGCCHEETPIYLAVWQRGHIVWTVRASGPRIHTAPTLSLVRSIEREVCRLDGFTTFATGLDHPEGAAWGPDGRIYAGGEAGQIYAIGLDGSVERGRRHRRIPVRRDGRRRRRGLRLRHGAGRDRACGPAAS